MSSNDKFKLVPKAAPTTAFEPQPEAAPGVTTAQDDAPPQPQKQALQLQVVAQGDKVVIQFSGSWIAFTPEQALAMSQALVHCAGLVHNSKPIIVVPGKG